MLWTLRRFAALALLTTSAVFAQAVSGNIGGTVLDPTGATVPNASVVITDLDRGTVYNVQSNNDGNFSQTHLLGGRYEVKVTSAGFGTYTATATVQVDATTSLDVKLSPANVQTSVEVTDATPLLTTDRAEIATTLTGKEVQQLPVLDRNVTNLLLIVPGALLNSELSACCQRESARAASRSTSTGNSSTSQWLSSRRHGKQQRHSGHRRRQPKHRLAPGVQGLDQQLRCGVRGCLRRAHSGHH